MWKIAQFIPTDTLRHTWIDQIPGQPITNTTCVDTKSGLPVHMGPGVKGHPVEPIWGQQDPDLIYKYFHTCERD